MSHPIPAATSTYLMHATSGQSGDKEFLLLSLLLCCVVVVLGYYDMSGNVHFIKADPTGAF